MPESVPLPLRGQLENARQLERQVDQLAKRASKNLKLDFTGGSKNIDSLSQPLGRITGKADEFTKSMEAANARVIAFGASVGILSAVTQSFKALVSTTIEVEKSLAKINSILNTNAAGLDKLKSQIFDIAQNTEQTFDTVAEAALELSRQGLSATEVTRRLNDSLVLSRLSGVDAAEAVGSLTAAVNGFSKSGLTTSEILNKVSAAANKFAVSERDIFEGFKRSASVAQQAGVSLDELGGIITAVQQKTARGGAVIGNSLKTIFTRIGKEESVSLLRELGVEITNVEGNLLPATQVIENLAKSFDSLSESQQRQVAFKIGGGFQIAPLLAALQDYSEENSIAIQATEAFSNATDEAYKKNIALNQTLAAGIQSTSLSVQELANTLGELGVKDVFGTLLTSIGGVVETITGILQGEGVGSTFARGLVKGISSLILPALGLVVVIIGKLSKDLIKFGIDSLKTFLGLSNAAERLKSVEERTYQILLNNEDVRKQILAIENASISAEQKKVLQSELFTKSLLAQKSVLLELQQISARVAPGVVAGVKGGRASRISRSAGGFLPIGAEQKDISKGVGGAPKGAKPVVIPNFAFGGGKRGTMVANNSEYIVPNFAGGGSAIFNQDMVKSMGLPSGAKKINAAGGFIPNFAAQKLNSKNKFVMLTGEKNKSNRSQKAYRQADGSFNLTPSKGATEINVPVYSLTDKTKSKDIDEFSERLETYAYRTALAQARSLSGGQMPDPVKRSAIKSSINKGSVGSFAGSIYELSLAALLTDEEFLKYSAATDTANFDLSLKGQNKLKDLYGISGSPSFGEVKGRGNPDNIKSTAAKIYRVLVGGKAEQKSKIVGQKLSNENAKKLGLVASGFNRSSYTIKESDLSKIGAENFDKFKKRRGSSVLEFNGAKGYIPNFAMSPLEDAIQREKEAGVPINQIRINQDGKLRNSQNPDGLAVTNTRDEPTGAIPKNAARGYVPNFVLPQNITDVSQLPKGGAESTSEALKKLGKEAGDTSKSINKQSKEVKDNSGKLFALSTAAFAVQGALSGMSQEADGFTKRLGEASAGLSGMLTTVLLLEGLNIKPGLSRNKDATFGRGLRDAGRAQRASGISSITGSIKDKGSRGFGSRLGSTLKGTGSVVAGASRAGLGKLLLGFSRLVPVLGAVTLGFQAVSAVASLFGVDLTKKLGEGLSKVGQVFGIVDTPAEKAAKALGKLSDEASKELFSRKGGPKSLTADIIKDINREASVKDSKKEDTPEQILTKILKTRQLDRDISPTIRKTTGVKRKKTQDFAIFGGEEIKINANLAKEIKKVSPGIQKITENALLETLSEADLSALKEDLTPDKVRELIEKQFRRLDKADQGKFRSLTGDRTVIEAKLARAEEGSEEKVKLKKEEKRILTEIAALEKKIADSSKGDDRALVLKEKEKKINAEIAKIQSESAFNIKLAIAGAKTEEEIRLGIKNTLKETSDLERFNNTTRLKQLESERKTRVKSATEFKKILDAQGAVRTLLQPDDNQEIDDKSLKEYNKVLDSISGKIIKNGEINEKNLKAELAAALGLDEKDKTLGVIVDKALAQLAATKQLASVELGRLQTSRAIAESEKIAAENRERQLKFAERQLSAETRRIDRNKESQDLADQIKIAGIRSQGIGGNSRAGASVQRQIAEVERAAKIREAGQSNIKAQEKLQTDFIAILREAGAKITKADIQGFRDAGSTNGDFVQFQSILERTAEEQKQIQINALELQKSEINTALANGDSAQINATAAKLQLEAAQLNSGNAIADAINTVTGSVEGSDADAGKEALNERLKVLDDQIKKVNELDFSLFLGKGEDAVLDLAKTVEVNGQKIILANLQFGNALAEAGASLTTFANLVRDEINSLDDQKAQSLFTLATSADPNAIQGALQSQGRIADIESRIGQGATAVDAIREANELVVFRQKELDLAQARTAAEKVAIQFEYDKTAEILSLRNQIEKVDPKDSEKIFEIEKKIAEIKAKSQTLSQKFQSEFYKTEEERIEELQDQIITGASQFTSTLADGINDVLVKGGDLGDVLVGAANDFFSELNKKSIKQILDVGVGKIGEIFGIPDINEESNPVVNNLKDQTVVLKEIRDNITTSAAVSSVSNAAGGTTSSSSTFGSIAKAVVRQIPFIGKFFADGGKVRGGSGSKDDVPAMLMGGEYVMKKSAVNKYGSSFMEDINNGNIPKFATGGMVNPGYTGGSLIPNFAKTQGGGFDKVYQKFAQGGLVIPEEEKLQSGRGGFFAPGTYGGRIQGKQQLLDFATQAFTSGQRDVISSTSSQFGGASKISLEPESVRLTNLGRKMGTPLQQATQEAKGQAFDLYGQQVDLEKQLEEQEKQRKEARKQLLINAAISIAGSAFSSFNKGGTGAVEGSVGGDIFGGFKGPEGGFFKGISQLAKGVGSYIKGGLFGNKIDVGGEEISVGGLRNILGPKGQMSNIEDLASYVQKNQKSSLAESLNERTRQTLLEYNIPKKATGGSIPDAAGVDTVPAMLSGGEFVMNSAATRRIGQGNLERMNSGVDVEGGSNNESSDRLVSKLDELITATKESTGEINITVNGESGESSEESSEGTSNNNMEMAKKLKEQVLKIIKEEKRLGGSLRGM